MKKLSLALLFLVIAVWPVWAQPVTVVGPITSGDCALFNSTTILKDAGFACNGSSGPVVFGPATSVVGDVAIWNNTTGNSLKDVAVWGAVAPVGGLPLFAAPTAAGTGTCLSSGNACTLATACSFVKQIATFLGSAGPIQLADGSGGSYGTATAGALCTYQGNSGGSSSQLLSINGNAITPSNVLLQVPSGADGFLIQDGAEVGINNVEITAVNGAGPGIQCRQNVICDYGGIVWGAWGNSGSHLSATGNGVTVNAGNETLLSSTTFINHWNISAGARVVGSGTTTIGSGVSWSGNFAQAVDGGIDVAGWTVSGTGTGSQFNGQGPGFLNLPNATSCTSKFPGSGGCQFSLGYQDSNGDAQTGTGLSVAQGAPTITDPILTAHTYAGLPGSPTAGQISHIIDGLAANCGDGTCTTPNTTVTGGGGALDLLIGWNGSNWLIFRAASAQATTGTGAVVHATSPTLVTPNLGTPSAAVLTNATGLPVAGGGTGNATAAAHSIPVSEGTSPQAAVGPCLTNQVIVGGGAGADPACGTNTAGSQQYLCTITASNSASINNASPTSGSCPINGTYTSYKLVFQNIIPATDSKILELQIHSGGAYKATGYSYALGLWGSNTANVINSNTGTYIPLSYPADSNNISLHNAAPGFSGEITIINPSVSGIIPVFGQIFYIGAGGTAFYGVGQTGGSWLTAGVVDGFQVLMDSGNLTSGSILVYGIL